MYQIKQYSYDRAKELGVHIQPSKKGKYKIDVFNADGDFITSIGHNQYSDYPTYIESHGLEYANTRRALYHIRHKKDYKERGFYSLNILW